MERKEGAGEEGRGKEKRKRITRQISAIIGKTNVTEF